MPLNNIFYICIHLLLLITAYYIYIYISNMVFKIQKYIKKYIFDFFLYNYIKLINFNNEYNNKV